MNSTAGGQAGQFSYYPTINAKKKTNCPVMDSPSSTKSSSSCPSTSSASRFCSGITQMNRDQLLSILQLLPVDSLISFSMTCRKFRSLGSSDALWESICRREWGNGHVDALIASFSSPERRTPWMTLYRQVSHMASVSCFRLGSEDGVFPKPRASHSLNCVSDCLVMFGGGCEGGRHLDDSWVAFVGNGVRGLVSWQPLKSGTPTGRFSHSCTVVGDWIVLFGGINDNGLRQNDTWIGQVSRDGSFDVSLSWSFLDVGSVAPAPRGAHAACCLRDEKLVIHGGIGLNGVRLDDMWILDLSTGLSSATWRLITTAAVKSPRPSARSGHTLTWIGGEYMVLFGGRGMGYQALNDVWLFNLSEECREWVEVIYDNSNAPRLSPLPTVGHSATPIFGDRVLIYGGEDSYRHRKDDFWLLDVRAILKTDMKMATVTSKKDLGKMWKKLQAEGQPPESRSFHAACTDLSGRYVYLFGGMVDGVVHPAEAYGLRFDGSLYLVDLVF